MSERLIRLTDREIAAAFPYEFPWGAHSVKVEVTDWYNEESKIGVGYDGYFPVADDCVVAIDHSSYHVTKVKLLGWPLPQYLAWEDDGGK